LEKAIRALKARHRKSPLSIRFFYAALSALKRITSISLSWGLRPRLENTAPLALKKPFGYKHYLFAGGEGACLLLPSAFSGSARPCASTRSLGVGRGRLSRQAMYTPNRSAAVPAMIRTVFFQEIFIR
jgi:hypothetical protein